MITTLAALKRALLPGVLVTMISRENSPMMQTGYDLTGVPREVCQVRGRGVAFKTVLGERTVESWLNWPPAAEVAFSHEQGSGAQLFTACGMTYRIEPCTTRAESASRA